MTSQKSLGTPLFLFLLFLSLFALITLSVVLDWGWIPLLDHAVQSAVFSLRCDVLTACLTPLTYSGNWQSVTLLCLVLTLLPKTRRWYGLPLMGCAIGSVTFYQLIKYAVRRIRPDVALHLIHQGGYSFPSGHTLTCVVVWGALLLLLLHYGRSAYVRPLQSQQIGPAARFSGGALHRPMPGSARLTAAVILIPIYIVLMGFSRIYLGVHWPTDVIGSLFLGLALLVPISRFIERI